MELSLEAIDFLLKNFFLSSVRIEYFGYLMVYLLHEERDVLFALLIELFVVRLRCVARRVSREGRFLLPKR